MVEISTLLVSGIIFAASFIAGISLLIVKELVKDGETAMAKLQLTQEQTIAEFRQLLFFHGMVLPGTVLVTLAGITGSEILINAGRSIIAIQGLGVLYIFYKWWRLF